MLAEDAQAYKHFSERLTADDFSSDIHKQLYRQIHTYYSEDRTGKCYEYLLGALPGNEKEISSVLMSVQNVANVMQATEDFVTVIENEIFNEKLQKAQQDGDIALISELLKTKKQKG